MLEKTELALIAAVVIVVFAGVFFFLSQKPSNETTVENNLLVKSGDPVWDIQKRLSGGKILVEQRLFAMNDSRNSAIAIMSSEIVRAIALQGKNASVYALVEGGENVCGETNCSGASIIVKTGGCNCVFFNPTQIIVEGDEKFLATQSVRVGRLVGFSLYRKK